MIKRLLVIINVLIISMVGMGQNNSTPGEQSFSGFFNAEKKYLLIPVKNGAPKRNIELWVDGVNTRFFDVELAEKEPDWFAYLQIDEWKGKEVELRVDKVAAGSKVFAPFQQSDADTNAGKLYAESMRGQLHFSPKRGWTNDPNGMVFYNGEYHLFFQHNPFGRGWGNMTWGHAVSNDMIHWKELGDVLHPDKFGPVFSGGAVVDENNTSGLGEAGKPAMVVFHTGARSWGQNLSWSTDGRSFKTLDHAVVPRINKENRDPKVIWYEPAKKWVMVLYVEREKKQHSIQFLTSPDLKTWTKTSVVNGGIGDDLYLFECPEFYELAVENTGAKKWVLTGANSEYAIGTFDGITFKPDEERLNNQSGRDFYAAQTFSNEPTGRRIEMGWWRTRTDSDSMTFNQSMSIPLEQKLIQTPDGIRISRIPVKELEKLRSKKYAIGNIALRDNVEDYLKNIKTELAEIRMEIEPGTAKEIVLNARGVSIIYNATDQQLIVDGVKAPAPLQNGKLDLIVYVDRTGLEIFSNKGLVYMPININFPASNNSYSLTAKSGTAKITGLQFYQLKSIWDSK